MTASQLVWSAAGSPAPKWGLEPASGYCATCGAPLEMGVHHKRINSPTFSQHADYFRYSNHVCVACAWLYGLGRARPGNFLVVGNRVWWPVISPDSETDDRPTWMRAFREASRMEARLPVTGVITTDVKPRLWPRARVASVSAFGIYVHAPEYDVSEWVEFDLARLIDAVDEIRHALKMGFSKTDVFLGLWRNFKRMKQWGKEGVEVEKKLSALRHEAYFVPALVAAGVKKEEKRGTARGIDANRKARSESDQGQSRLL